MPGHWGGVCGSSRRAESLQSPGEKLGGWPSSQLEKQSVAIIALVGVMTHLQVGVGVRVPA